MTARGEYADQLNTESGSPERKYRGSEGMYSTESRQLNRAARCSPEGTYFFSPNDARANPPFVGGMYMSDAQKKEIRELFDGIKGAGEFDYVTGWYKKAVEFSLGTAISCAFVSTNSICQGSQVITFWKHLIERYSIHIDFAHTTFVWNSEAQNQAKVHCVIVGFSGINAGNKPKRLFSSETTYKFCNQISPYLTDTPITVIESRSTP